MLNLDKAGGNSTSKGVCVGAGVGGVSTGSSQSWPLCVQGGKGRGGGTVSLHRGPQHQHPDPGAAPPELRVGALVMEWSLQVGSGKFCLLKDPGQRHPPC